MKKIKEYWGRYRELILYALFGAVTTAVNYAVYLPCYNLLHLSGAVSNVVSWAFSVIVAFLLNKQYVFCSRDWSPEVSVPELVKFVGCRLASGVMETVILLITVDFLRWNGNLWKLITSILVILINYVGSRLLVFRKGKK